MTSILLKDHLFNSQKIQRLADEIGQVYAPFNRTQFHAQTLQKFPELELKARIGWIRDMLAIYLPQDYREATRVLLAALPLACDATLSDDDFGDFIYAPYSEFVAKFGCNREDLDFSLNALKSMTTRFSSENAIRYFLNAFPEETLNTLQTWCSDSHYHVRRLACEGTRPKLPWAPKIGLKPEDSLPILELLYTDPTRYVTRSVANHLNDLSKLKPEYVCLLLKKWKILGKQTDKELKYILKHSLRTLIKLGHPDALKLLDISPNTQVLFTHFKLQKSILKVGEPLAFEFSISSPIPEALIIDYIVYFQSKWGGMTSKKVYKLKQLTLSSQAPVLIQKQHPLRENMSTRILYPGEHQVEIMINGKKMGSLKFERLA